MSPKDHSTGFIHVVAAAVTAADGRVLIAQRPPGKQLAGSWEFPGGKLEAGESRSAGLARELREELGITIRDPRPLMRLRHSYPFGEVLIDMWVVSRYRGEPQGLDGQALRWCTLDELATADLLPADRPLVRALRLPERLSEVSGAYYGVGDLQALRDSAVSAQSPTCAALRGVICADLSEALAAASSGADFLVLSEVLALAELTMLCRSVAVPVYVRGLDLEAVWTAGASGLSEL